MRYIPTSRAGTLQRRGTAPCLHGRCAAASVAGPARVAAFGLVLLGLLICSACGSTGSFIQAVVGEEAQPPDSTRAYTVYLIGDAGAPRTGATEPTLKLLKRALDAEGPNSAVVFLGDNIYPTGMPPITDPGREEAERRIDEQLKAIADFQGQVVFVPGNHDWGGGGYGGSRSTLLREELYIERALDQGNTFLPDRGFPGPLALPLNDDIVLLALDTQWWLEARKTYGDTGQYEVEQEGSVLVELDDLLRRNAAKKILVVGHHPVFSNGAHGGQFASGILMPLTRRYLGPPQDLSNYNYRRMRSGLLAVFGQHENLIYAAGHEHNLQYFKHDGQHYVVSGAGSKSGYVAERRGASFTSREKGWARLHYYTDGSVWLEFWVPEDDGATGKRVYAIRLEAGDRPLVPYRPSVPARGPGLAEADTTATEAAGTDGSSSTTGEAPFDPTQEALQEPYAFHSLGSVTVVPGAQYHVGALKKLFLGSRYRTVWNTPVGVPIIDLERTAGGLTPIKKGGGFQTVSLRLQGADGDQYVLRSVDKDVEKVLPQYLLDTFVQDIARDQNSAINPYGAFLVPPLADAAGIYHTTPRLVVIPDDPRLGIYQKEFAGMLALFETRPDENQRDEARFGNPEDIIGSDRLFEKLQEDNDHRVDERAFARARLFDMLIGDWDRHADQWRWAAFEPHELDPSLTGEARTQGKVYRPIPRDRDFAFYKFDGPIALLAKLAGDRRLKKFSNFGPRIKNLEGLNYNGAPLDHRFTAGLTRADWLALADTLRTRLTDDVIEEAFRVLPPPVFAEKGEALIADLEARRDRLPEAAAAYYALLARAVDVVGSDKHERFEVTRLGDDDTEVVVIKTDSDGKPLKERYRRVFHRSETKEVRLYGLGGNDQFIFAGEAADGVRVRALGGYGEDAFIDASQVKRRALLPVLYDAETGNRWQLGADTHVHYSYDPINHVYPQRRFETPDVGFVPSFDFSSEDRLFVGGGVRYRTFGFRKEPFASSHTVKANVSPTTQAANVYYEGVFTGILRDWNGHLDAHLEYDNNIRNFYGMGNGTPGDPAARERFRAVFTQLEVTPYLSRPVGLFRTLSVGPRFEFTNVDLPRGRRPGDPNVGYTPDELVDKYYVGVQAAFDVTGTDTLAVTRSGARWLNRASLNTGVINADKTYFSLSSELSYFYTFDLPTTLTLAFRVGAATNIGHFEFYQANYLGGSTNLRGYRKGRFAGHSSFFQNLELRATLFDFNAYVARGQGGVLAFFDNGRVWASGEDSSLWHQGAGAGLWLNPLGRYVLTGSVGFSREGTVIHVKTHLLF